ncbi:hypothetical protein SDC9_113201 [bioreactor metagenome]|uniref:Uncharacterized protein n=1 Tax=bioreactor metagenome TaxID=1076179 RepID=A0A645BX27_9ZZZZ
MIHERETAVYGCNRYYARVRVRIGVVFRRLKQIAHRNIVPDGDARIAARQLDARRGEFAAARCGAARRDRAAILVKRGQVEPAVPAFERADRDIGCGADRQAAAVEYVDRLRGESLRRRGQIQLRAVERDAVSKTDVRIPEDVRALQRGVAERPVAPGDGSAAGCEGLVIVTHRARRIPQR